MTCSCPSRGTGSSFQARTARRCLSSSLGQLEMSPVRARSVFGLFLQPQSNVGVLLVPTNRFETVWGLCWYDCVKCSEQKVADLWLWATRLAPACSTASSSRSICARGLSAIEASIELRQCPYYSRNDIPEAPISTYGWNQTWGTLNYLLLAGQLG